MRVGIIGGGFAGLAAAIAFRQVGHEVTLYERARGPAMSGGAIVLARNALACLSILGLGRIGGDGWSDVPATVRRPDGRILVRSSISGLTGGGEVVTVPRAQVIRWLTDRLPSTCLQFSAAVLHISPDGTVRTTNDQQRFDLVVAADGTHSLARSLLWPSAPSPTSTGVSGWAWIVEEAVDRFGTIWGVNADFGILPLVDGRTYVYGGTPPNTTLQDYRDWADPLPALIDAAQPETTITPEIFEARPPMNLRRGNVVLIGDAAHAMRPTFGQGAALAMEDAIVLAYSGVRGLNRRQARMLGMYYASKAGARFATPGWAPLAAIRDWGLQITPDPVFGAMAGVVSRWKPPCS